MRLKQTIAWELRARTAGTATAPIGTARPRIILLSETAIARSQLSLGRVRQLPALMSVRRILWRGAVLALAACTSAAGLPRVSRQSPTRLAQDSCTADLLAHAAPYDARQVLALVGRYRWVWVDTVSTRRPDRLPEAFRGLEKAAASEIRLWEADTVLARGALSAGRERRWVGRVAGAIIGTDTAGFGPSRPQLEVLTEGKGVLSVVYDRRVWEGLLDGGDVVDWLPIEVAGPWGFGGHYVRRSQFVFDDLDGNPIPPFAGYYCALRIE